MLRNKKSKVRVFSLLVCSLVAVSVYCYDAVCIFIYHDAMRIHAEGTHIILKSCVLYTILLSYSSSVRCEKIRAGSSTRTPISTRFDLVGISRSLQTFSIHLLPLLPTEMIQYLLSYVLSAVLLHIRIHCLCEPLVNCKASALLYSHHTAPLPTQQVYRNKIHLILQMCIHISRTT